MFKIPFFSRTPKKPPKYVTLEINSESVKCLAFYSENGTKKVIGSAKELLEPGVVRNGVIIDFGAVVDATDKALEHATRDSGERVNNVVIGVTSDMCQENVTTAKISRGTGDPITQKEIENFQEKIVESAYMQVLTNHSAVTGKSDTDFELITSSTVYSKLDGKKVDNLLEQTGQTVEMALYTAYSPAHHIKTLKKLAKKLKLNILAISSMGYALLDALSNTEKESSDFVLAQVGSDFTNVSVVFGGAIVANKTLPLGKRHFVEEISRIMGLTVNESQKVIDTHSRGELSSSESVVVQNCLGDVLDIWLEGIETLFSDFSGVKTFAPHIYLFGEGTHLPEIEETLTKSPWTKAIPFKSPPTVEILTLEPLSKVVDATGHVVDNEWLVPSTLAYIYDEL